MIDFDILFKVVGIGLLVTFLYHVLEQLGKKEFGHWVVLVGFFYVLYLVITIVEQVLHKIRAVFFWQSGW